MMKRLPRPQIGRGRSTRASPPAASALRTLARAAHRELPPIPALCAAESPSAPQMQLPPQITCQTPEFSRKPRWRLEKFRLAAPGTTYLPRSTLIWKVRYPNKETQVPTAGGTQVVAQRLTNSRLEGVRRRVYRQSESDMHLVRYFEVLPCANSTIFSTNWSKSARKIGKSVAHF